MKLSRILTPVLSSKAGKYGQDPMSFSFKPFPILHPVEKLRSMDPDSDEYKTLKTGLVKERNKLSDALNSANRILSDTINKI